MKTALVHDFLIQNGGAEATFKVFTEMFPNAPIFTLVYDKNKIDPSFKNKKIIHSFIQNMPFGRKKYQWFLPLMPAAIEQLNLMDYDLIISSSSAFANGIITRPEALHICYCHTPTRYLWTDSHSYVKELNHNKIIKKIIPLALSQLRIWDLAAAERPDFIIANSGCVKKRIKKYYNRESEVIFPPVDVKRFYISSKVELDKSKGYFLIGGRLVSYKKYDLVIKAFNKLGIKLKIFGEGPEFKKLKKMAKPHIEILGKVNDIQKAELYGNAIAFLHPQEEDFGITAVESMAAGRPVIAYKAGGALETVIDGMSGDFFDEQEWEVLADTIIKFKPEKFNPADIRRYAESFDISEFKKKIENYINKKISFDKTSYLMTSEVLFNNVRNKVMI